MNYFHDHFAFGVYGLNLNKILSLHCATFLACTVYKKEKVKENMCNFCELAYNLI